MWRLAEDTIDADDLAALADWLRDGPQLTAGPLVREFEAAWSHWVGARTSVMVSSGTAANLLLLMAVLARWSAEGRPRARDTGPGRGARDAGPERGARDNNEPLPGADAAERLPRIGVAALTWSTNVTPALLLGCPVVVFDADPCTLGVDRDQVREAVRAGRIDVLFVTHVLGLCALDDELVAELDAAGVLLIEDCCEAHGARLGDRRVGTIGLAGTFSFYYGHHMSTIEGGVVATDDVELADTMRMIRAHGLARESDRYDTLAGAHPDIDPRFLFVETGLNLRATDVNAFLGLRQLGRLDERIAVRNANLDRLLDGLGPGYWRTYRRDGASSFALPLIADGAARAAHVDEVADRLDIQARPVIAGNLLRQPFMRRHQRQITALPTPVADHVHRFGRYVGNGPHVAPDDVDRLLTALAGAS